MGSDLLFLDGCAACKAKSEQAFCNLPPDTLQLLDQISLAVTYPAHVKLFSEDQPCRGVFILCSGKAKVTASRGGKPLMLRVAESGDVLGLSAAFARRNYEVNAETLAPSVVRFMKREDFIRFLGSSSDALANVMRILSLEYQQALESLRNLGLLNTATARIAQLLLNICADPGEQNEAASARFLLTQEQIAQMT